MHAKSTRRTVPAALALGVVLWGLSTAAAPAARALSISGITLALDPLNTADALVNSGANRSQIASALALSGPAPVAVADVTGASVSFDSRYAALLAADRESGGGTTAQNANRGYSITFTVDNPSARPYQLDIDTRRVGAIVVVDDGSGTASASVGAVSALLDGASVAGLGLSAVSGGSQAFAQSSTTLSLFDSAVSRTFTLEFAWSSSATSSRDEVAVLLGLAGGLSSTTADDYPGPLGRTASGDGHLVSVRATLLPIPEPATAVLVALGLAALAVRRTPRSR